MTELVHVSRPETGIVVVEIDNPPANALGGNTRRELEAALDGAEKDLSVRCVVLTGRGKGFCSGDDLHEAKTRGIEQIQSLGQLGQLFDRIENLRMPVIAAVNGYAVGGGLELTLCCDIRIAAKSAWFLGAAVKVGLVASAFRLPRLVGIGPAKAMLLTGAKVSAETALQFGLVTQVCEDDELLDQALEVARQIASRAPLAVEAAKRLTDRAYDMGYEGASALENMERQLLSQTRDHHEAVAAFSEHRDPQFNRS